MRREFSHAGGPENQEINFLWPNVAIKNNTSKIFFEVFNFL